MTDTKQSKGLGIRAKILLIFSVFSFVSLVIISGIIGGFLSVMNNTVTTESEAALNNQIETNLNKSATENAFTIGEKIDNAIASVQFLAAFAENLFENPTLYGEYPSYNDTTIAQEGLNAEFYTDEGYGSQYISFEYSMYHLAPTVYNPTLGYTSANSTVQELINVSANLDHVFKYAKEANPEFGWIYVGLEVGLFRNYPWSMYDTQYDPRLRPWYDFSGETRADGIKITDPYMDANGLGLMITIAKEIFVDGDKIGTIAVDLTVAQIQETILDINILETGYAFLINSEGLAIAHKDLENPEDGEDLTTNIQDLEDIPNDVLQNLLTDQNGFFSYDTIVGTTETTLYIAFSKIENTEFIVASVVYQEEAIQSVETLSLEIDKVINRVTVELIIIIAIAAVISIGIGTLIAGQITKPVGSLTRAIKKLTKQDAISTIINTEDDILIDSELESQGDEIGDLTRAFKGMLNSIRDEQKK